MTREERYEIYNGTAIAIVNDLETMLDCKLKLKKLPKIKPQFLIDDDDEYQDNLELSYEKRDLLSKIEECNEAIIDNISFFSENGLSVAFKAWLVHTGNGDKIEKLKNLGFDL